MITTRVFKSGNSQAVRIPHEFQLDVEEVEILRRGDELVLRKKPENLSDVLDIFAALPDDFMQEGREDLPPQERDFDQ
uniref:AbrB/MazE/SpoVT family DNA-binding domain-containing protein n=1 Tax=uncultured Thiotrichaceae bacterium TaxID=298394 RepID=A0A6S6UIA3_9GAMM|nr:MAG: AbrB/MazE/SpoVT family DNA-binding domain-containing protein [uncultured Thiotrichaceae bacterium]